MAEVYPFQQLIEMLLGRGLAEPPRRSLQLIQERVIQVLEDQVEPPFPTEHFNHVHQMLVPEFL